MANILETYWEVGAVLMGKSLNKYYYCVCLSTHVYGEFMINMACINISKKL